jgi:LysR family transcriptional regulator, glycine cleavage system transcriptional activator
MRRFVPSLSALQAFEAAARHLSFTRAAAELNITQSAISRHVLALEEQLGFPLFQRAKQRVSLTEAGQSYLPEVRTCLDRLEASTTQILTYRRGGGVLNIAILPTFGTKWLMPRLPDFCNQNPGIVINFFTRTEPFDFSGSDIDAAIYFGAPAWPNIHAEHLIGETLVPVCSPKLARPGSRPATLARHRLLRLLPLPRAWPQWFEAAGIGDVEVGHSLGFEHFSMCIEAAISGLGVALMPDFLVVEDIRAGRLCVPHPRTIRTELAYFLIYPNSKHALPTVRSFRDWAIAAASATEGECRRLLGLASGHLPAMEAVPIGR